MFGVPLSEPAQKIIQAVPGEQMPELEGADPANEKGSEAKVEITNSEPNVTSVYQEDEPFEWREVARGMSHARCSFVINAHDTYGKHR